MAVNKVVFASSAAVYGEVDKMPVGEEQSLAPLSPYGIHKRTNELWARYCHAVHGVASVGLRFFNVYGPRQDPHSPYSGVISIFAERARTGIPLTIFGDGTQTRDFVYVQDVARAVCDALFADEVTCDVFNIGTGVETTVNALAETIVTLSHEHFGTRSEIRHRDARPGEIRRSLASIDKARRAYGFAPKHDLAEGLRVTLAALAE
jgi:UDP-glucose 4-epimerase